jgi:hypothetical protein
MHRMMAKTRRNIIDTEWAGSLEGLAMKVVGICYEGRYLITGGLVIMVVQTYMIVR